MQLPFKKIHLDFHTSPEIPDVGRDFNPDIFADILKETGVESLTCFAKCQHGCHYYPSNTGFRHPNLKRDLLGEMISACHKNNIQVDVYYDICNDKHVINGHPGWRQVNLAGEPRKSLCINNHYPEEFIFPTVEELITEYDFEGLFFDSLWYIDWYCACDNCRERAIKEGYNPDHIVDMTSLSRKIHLEFMEKMTGFIHAKNPELRIIYNSRYHSPHFREDVEFYSHIEIEALATHPGWGYFCFPTFAKYIRMLNKPYYGMAGRFSSWGQTGFMLDSSQMLFETVRFTGNGAGISIGDHLHPRGVLDAAVYHKIKEVFDYHEKCREYVTNTDGSVTEAAILMEPAIEWDGAHFGLVKLLMEEHILFDIPDRWCDLSKYRLLIIPDSFTIDSEMMKKISDFSNNGGAILAIGKGIGKTPEHKTWAKELFGVSGYEETEFSIAFCLPNTYEYSGLENFHYEVNNPVAVNLQNGQAMADLFWPYWETSKDKPCGHTYAPWNEKSGFPAIVHKGKNIYISFPVGKPYYHSGNPFLRNLIRVILGRLLPGPIIKIQAPGSVETILNKQGENLVLHLIQYSPTLRGTPHMEFIEDGYPLKDIPITIKTKHRIKYVTLVPDNIDISFSENEDKVSFTIPELDIHQMILLKICE